VADGLAHPPHLAIPALSEHELQQALLAPPPGERLENAHARRRRPAAVDDHAALQPGDDPGIRHAAHHGVIRLLHAVARVREPGGQVAVVGDDEQAFRVVIEAPDGVDVVADSGEQIEDRRAALRVRPCRDVSRRLVQQDVARPPGGADAPAVHADVVAGRIGLRAELAHDDAVDRDAPLHDQGLGRTA